MSLKILLIAGHGAGDPGACSDYGIESNETRRVVNNLKSELEAYNGVQVFLYPIGRNAYADIKNGCCQINFADYDYVFEVHFNSAGNVSANGTEIWVTNSEQVTKVEQSVVNKISTALGISNRGVKREDFCVIRTAKSKGVSSALVELCFISNAVDMNKYNSNFNKVCVAIADGIAEGFGLTKNTNAVANKPVVTTPQPTEKPKVQYWVKTSNGKQLGAFGVLDNAKNMAKSNKAIVYDANGKVVISYVPQATSKKYVNLKSHMTGWNVYPLNKQPVIGNQCGKLNPSLGKASGGLSYTVLEEKGSNVYVINTSTYGKVQIYCPNDNDGSVGTKALYEFVN